MANARAFANSSVSRRRVRMKRSDGGWCGRRICDANGGSRGNVEPSRFPRRPRTYASAISPTDGPHLTLHNAARTLHVREKRTGLSHARADSIVSDDFAYDSIR